jgi:uncharacterized protein (TIGR00156 family)
MIAAGAPGAVAAEENGTVTAVEAAAQNSESWVRLEGRIVESLGNQRYRFEDDSGAIQMHIEADQWRGHEVAATTPVRIVGQLKKRGDRTEVKVDRLTVLD